MYAFFIPEFFNHGTSPQMGAGANVCARNRLREKSLVWKLEYSRSMAFPICSCTAHCYQTMIHASMLLGMLLHNVFVPQHRKKTMRLLASTFLLPKFQRYQKSFLVLANHNLSSRFKALHTFCQCGNGILSKRQEFLKR